MCVVAFSAGYVRVTFVLPYFIPRQLFLKFAPALLLTTVQAVTSALALGWSCFAATLSSSEPDTLVSLAVKAVAMLEQCSKAAAEAAAKGTAPDTAGNIGACLSGAEQHR